ncbi:hypothetical protein GBAR_LOCUS21154 [Geodia barretti]|uniref:Uncharacterized protein n=1 Tax=Geodia barretti TaxID=519541 RepID=A0AA35WXU1_GEOBA|nr:hypothetical protein GBAR_LOCUS21154 [Geodia barretti]CAI8037868.1 hypothetical protein GBAR_LOCUS21154 [Geodia barretti]
MPSIVVMVVLVDNDPLNVSRGLYRTSKKVIDPL